MLAVKDLALAALAPAIEGRSLARSARPAWPQALALTVAAAVLLWARRPR